MKAKQFFAAAALTLALSTVSAQTVSKAFESTLASFTPPASENGGVTFKPCLKCSATTLRVTSATRYEIDGNRVSFDQFRKVVATIRDRDSVGLTVLHHLESGQVQLVSIALPERIR